jgi:hypothetical protein
MVRLEQHAIEKEESERRAFETFRDALVAAGAAELGMPSVAIPISPKAEPDEAMIPCWVCHGEKGYAYEYMEHGKATLCWHDCLSCSASGMSPEADKPLTYADFRLHRPAGAVA